ncbi:MAG: hypothetical protein RL326_1166 [Pseudomonadota bacterium]
MTVVMEFILFVRLVSAEKNGASRTTADASVLRRTMITGGHGSVRATLRAGTDPNSQPGGQGSAPAALRNVRNVGGHRETLHRRGRRGRRPSLWP